MTVAICFAVALTVLGLAGSSPAMKEPAYLSTQDALLTLADELEQRSQFRQAIPIYERLINEGAGRDVRWTAYVMFRLACAQLQAGDPQGALESTQGAATMDPSESSYRILLDELKSPQRKRSALYRAYRDTGSAKRLTAKNGVLHIFVRGRNSDPWDAEERDDTRKHVDMADRWISARAAENLEPVAARFEHRYLSVSDEPFFRKTDVPEHGSSADFRESWMAALLLRFGAASYAELFDRTFEGRDYDNRAVVLHALHRGISFAALATHQRARGDMEYAFVQEERSPWFNPYPAFVYTHEVLHLYGADDLYNKSREPGIPEYEIMNYGSPQLDGCVMSPVTRYAVGWLKGRPALKVLRWADLAGNPKRKKGATR